LPLSLVIRIFLFIYCLLEFGCFKVNSFNFDVAEKNSGMFLSSSSYFLKIFEIQNFLLEYFILLMQNWKWSWCKLMCLSMMLLNCEDYRFFILSSSLVFLSSTFFFAAVCELNCRALLFLCAQLMT
jgi:hypothetical protein